MALLETDNIHVGYGKTEVLHGISLKVKSGTINCVVGPNGCGKSTFLKSIFGFLKPGQGKILFRGDDITYLSPQETLRSGISFILQRRSIFPDLSVKKNIKMGAFTRTDSNTIKEDLADVMELFPALQDKQHQKAGELSGGQARMVELARGLMVRPTLMLLDEPSAGLAPKIVQDALKTLTKLNQEQNVTLIVVEQRVRMILKMADYGFLFSPGELKMEGEPHELEEQGELEQMYFSS